MAVGQLDSKRKRVSAVLRNALRDAEWVRSHPEIIQDYAGQWIVIQNGQIVAHSHDGASLTTWANIDRFPDATLRYIPDQYELNAVRIL